MCPEVGVLDSSNPPQCKVPNSVGQFPLSGTRQSAFSSPCFLVGLKECLNCLLQLGRPSHTDGGPLVKAAQKEMKGSVRLNKERLLVQCTGMCYRSTSADVAEPHSACCDKSMNRTAVCSSSSSQSLVHPYKYLDGQQYALSHCLSSPKLQNEAYIAIQKPVIPHL